MVMDNHSQDQSIAYIKSHFPQIRLLESRENLGFGGGNNLAARQAQGRYVVFLNNDMMVDPLFVQELIQAVQSDPEAVCASAKILNWDGSRIDFGGAAAHFAGFAYQVGFQKPVQSDLFTQIQPILFPCGGAMLIDRKVFIEVGGFDENYFIYYDDLDLGWRLWILGYKVLFAPQALVYHKHQGTMEGFSDYRKNLLYKRNTLYSVLKNYEETNLGKILPAMLLGTVHGVLAQAQQQKILNPETFQIQSKKKPASRSCLSLKEMSTLIAIQEVVERLPEVMEKRKFVQERRKRSDWEISQLFRWPFRFWPGVDPATQYKVVDAFQIHQIFEGLPRKVLVISSDILPYPGLPTVGSGLRAWGIGQGLKSWGHEVIFSMPCKALSDGREKLVIPEVKELCWEPETMLSVIHKVDPDVIVVCNWPLLDLLPRHLLSVPVILDQHGPHFMEREYQKFGDPEENRHHKINALGKADFFSCAGKKQHPYFQDWLTQAGWTEGERRELTAAVPVSLSPELPDRHPAGEITFVYGGIFLPWQDPSKGLLTLLEVLEEEKNGRLCFFGGKHPFYPVDVGIFEDLIHRLKKSPRVEMPGMVSHQELIQRYCRSHVAIDLMARNPERELAFTTRTVEYLWCGLPVIYHDYAELSEYIRSHDAGWVVDPEDTKTLAGIIREILRHPEIVEEKSRNAQRLIREKLTWDKTMGALDHFIRHPAMRPHPFQKETLKDKLRWKNLPFLYSQARYYFSQGGFRRLWEVGKNYLKR